VGDGFVIALAHGPGADWVRNVLRVFGVDPYLWACARLAPAS
jgi:hypothetical protein